MRTDAVWNSGGYWEAPRFSSISNIKIDITKCIIKFNAFGFIDLLLNEKRVKRLTFKEYLKFKAYVKNVIHWEV